MLTVTVTVTVMQIFTSDVLFGSSYTGWLKIDETTAFGCHFFLISLSVLTVISRRAWVGQYQSVSILGFIGAKDDGSGGENWSPKTCRAPVILSPPTNQHPVFYRPDALPVAQSIEEKVSHSMDLVTQAHLRIFQPCL